MPVIWANLTRGKPMYKANRSFVNSYLGKVTKGDSIQESNEAKKLFNDGYLTKAVAKLTKTKEATK